MFCDLHTFTNRRYLLFVASARVSHDKPTHIATNTTDQTVYLSYTGKWSLLTPNMTSEPNVRQTVGLRMPFNGDVLNPEVASKCRPAGLWVFEFDILPLTLPFALPNNCAATCNFETKENHIFLLKNPPQGTGRAGRDAGMGWGWEADDLKEPGREQQPRQQEIKRQLCCTAGPKTTTHFTKLAFAEMPRAALYRQAISVHKTYVVRARIVGAQGSCWSHFNKAHRLGSCAVCWTVQGVWGIHDLQTAHVNLNLECHFACYFSHPVLNWLSFSNPQEMKQLTFALLRKQSFNEQPQATLSVWKKPI